MPDAAKFADLLTSIEAQLEEAYKRGVRDERERIMRAAAGESVAALPPPTRVRVKITGSSLAEYHKELRRVAHGTVRPVVRQVLAETPGLTAAELGRRAVALNPSLAITSVANELRRNKGKLYRRTKGGRWHLLSEQELEDDTAGIAAGDHPPHMNGAG